jgi:hypothetical protein
MLVGERDNVSYRYIIENRDVTPLGKYMGFEYLFSIIDIYINNLTCSEQFFMCIFILFHNMIFLASERSQMCPSEIPHPVTQSTLVIKQSRGSDTGTYVCKARNIMGVYSYKIRILVRGKTVCF